MSGPVEPAGDGTLSWRALWVETAERLGGEANEARWLCQAASGLEGVEWIEGLDRPCAARAVARVDAMVGRRRSGEPLQYVLGSWSFRGLELMVDRRVLIPRPETELVVDVALEQLRRTARPSPPPSAGGSPAIRRPRLAADLGTGSGAIALALVAELAVGSVEVWATDVSADALDVARANVAGLGRRGGQVRLAKGDWFAALPPELAGRLDLVVANPPYVADGDELGPEVRDWEPVGALLAGPHGLDAIRRIAGDSPRWLSPGASLVMEIGAGQGSAAAALAVDARLVDVEVRADLAGRDRILVARRPA